MSWPGAKEDEEERRLDVEELHRYYSYRIYPRSIHSPHEISHGVGSYRAREAAPKRFETNPSKGEESNAVLVTYITYLQYLPRHISRNVSVNPPPSLCRRSLSSDPTHLTTFVNASIQPRALITRALSAN